MTLTSVGNKATSTSEGTLRIESGIEQYENGPGFSSPPKASEIDLSILIVCYKSRDLILQCLRGVHEHTAGCRYEVLMVDCSNDGAIDLVKAEFPSTRIIENSENLGFGKGNNFLEAYAVGQYLLLLNPDVIVTDDAISELYRSAVARPEVGAIGGRTRMLNGQRDPGCRQFAPTLFRLAVCVIGGARFLNGGLKETATAPENVETLLGAFMIVRRDAWQEVGGFDTSFFMYSEELDLCQRLIQRGWSVMMTPRAEIIHLVGGGDGQNPKRVFLMTKARMHYFRKYWNRFHVALGGFLLWFHAVVRVVLGTVCLPLIGRDRARRLQKAYSPIAFHPGTWWRGFENENA